MSPPLPSTRCNQNAVLINQKAKRDDTLYVGTYVASFMYHLLLGFPVECHSLPPAIVSWWTLRHDVLKL